MAHELVLKNARVITPEGELWGGVGIDEGRITAVKPDSDLDGGKTEIDLREKILLPGMFDPHIHFGLGDKIGDESMAEDFLHDTKDCLIGGVTTIATTTLLGSDSLVDLFRRARHSATGQSWCDFKITSVVTTPKHVEEIPFVAREGGVSYKFFTGYIGDQAEGFGMGKDGVPPDMFHAACEAFAKCGSHAFAKIHAEDPYVRGILVDRLRKMGRSDKLVAWAESSPEWAESVQIYTYGAIANQLSVPLYPVHVSSGHTVDCIEHLNRQGYGIVAETVSGFLATTAPEMDAKGLGAKAKIQPPIRFDKDKERLWKGIKDGVIQIVGTDSVPYSSQFKEQDDFWDCRVGLNLQMADSLTLLYDEGINGGRIDLNTLAKVTSENASRIYGIYPKKGAIAPGSDADLVVMDPEREVLLGLDRMRSRADYSIWEGRKVRGSPVMTFLRGELVMQDGEIVEKVPRGRFVDSI